MKIKSFIIILTLLVCSALNACSSDTADKQITGSDTVATQSNVIDLGEKLIAGEFTTDLGKEAANSGGYYLLNESEHGYDCVDALGNTIFSCKTYDKNITYKIVAENEMLTIFGVPLNSTLDVADSALSQYSFECTIDNSENGLYYRVYYVYASDTVFYEVGLFYNPDTMKIYDYEISRMDYS